MKKGVLVLAVVLLVGAFAVFIGQSNPNPSQTVKEESAPSPEAALAPAESYDIAVSAIARSAYEVALNVTTNIPLPVEVMASISIKGQNPQDTYIGASKRVTLTAPEQEVTIDGRSEDLPSGEYVAEVTFYPRWGAKNGPAAAKLIEEEITGQADVSLTGSGASKSEADEKNTAQKWVMLNVNIGMPWNESLFVGKLGPFTKSAADLNHHDAYYFEKADMTIIVNRIKNSVAIWRMGRASK